MTNEGEGTHYEQAERWLDKSRQVNNKATELRQACILASIANGLLAVADALREVKSNG